MKGQRGLEEAQENAVKIEQGILIPHTLVPVGEGVTGASYAVVSVAGLSQRCVVKQAGDREIAAECLCALLGDALGLPTLTPLVITDPRDSTLCFGAREAGYPSLSGSLRIGTHADASQMQALACILSAWSQVGQVISFDELVANGDRNPGNVLWNGINFTIIDHERALGIRPMQQNRLAFFATNQFKPPLVAAVQSASTSAALAQQALLGAGSAVWQMIDAEFASVPAVIAQHRATFASLAQGNLGSLATKTANSMSPLFARQQP
ncbi:hypothetical protein EVC45_31255 [Paraburkholderia sp. UYCP14C]|uniref:hypothetical protein n=1 Tax=Paraburkholderia sp. UYCP14C TaxID=2511130 RepID=UPI00101ECB48|nr:hypothetical protein [Paraburkholderia sp. UYCP14C]RZF25892.1 hypothetical protein EVC45_31255 [Paraburkholderia sp. UYCP14C]